MAAWALLGPVRALEGFGYGSRYPALVLLVQGEPLTPVQHAALAVALQPVWPQAAHLTPLDARVETSAENGFKSACDWLLLAVQQMQLAAGVAVEDRGRILALNATQAQLLLPSSARGLPALVPCVQALLALLRSQAAGLPIEPPIQQLTLALATLTKTRPSASNSPRFVRAALALGLPVQELPGGIVQYGHGQYGRWLDSSFTDETPLLSTLLTRDKTRAASLLRTAGLPVPAHQRVGSVEQALRVAGQLGYPVVVKPASLDGGLGVAAGLQNPADVTAAFQASQRYSTDTLLEKHVDGRDYRLVVFQDELILAVERVPGGVTGDGVQTVEQLLVQLNADPRRGTDAHALLKHVALDDEAQGLLQSAGLTAASVPALAQWVRLRRTANVATGGMPVSVLAQVHPDNRLLAVRAAKTLRLDLAGVDVLMPDIRRSWRDGGAGICEVNSQPSLGQITSAPVYAQILRRLVPGDGRIPILLVLGAPADSRCAADIEAALHQRGVCVGCHDAAGVRVNGVPWLDAGATPYAAGRLLALDRSVQVLVLSVNDASLLQTGLPFDRFDFLLRAGPPDVTLDPVLQMILPACSGRVVSLADAGMTPAALVDWGVTVLTKRLHLDETNHAQAD